MVYNNSSKKVFSMEQEQIQSYHALQIAFQTMKERCQQLQAKLLTTEKENIHLRQQNKEYISVDSKSKKGSSEDENNLYTQKVVEELKKQKSQLLHHIYMVSSENRQLWIRLEKLMHANKSLEFLKHNQSVKSIEHNIEEKDPSLKEVSLCFIHSNIIGKPEQQYTEIAKMQKYTEINLTNVGFTYLEDVSEDSLEHLKFHDAKLTNIKEALLSQQKLLSDALQNLKKVNKSTIYARCKQNSKEESIHQIKTQSDSKRSSNENQASQTSLLTSNLLSDKIIPISDDNNDNICPICGINYEKTLSFDLFHEHVVSHFTKEIPDNFKMIT